MARPKPMRLPPVPRLRVKNAQRSVENPCLVMMSQLLSCWASFGLNTTGCAALEASLRTCTDGPQPAPAPSNSINYHLGRMYKNIVTSQKRR